MRLAPEVTCTALVRHSPDGVPMSQLFLNGKALDRPIHGAILQGAVAWEQQYLVFLTDGIDYEDLLNIHLFDVQLQLLDSATIGMPYTTGSFEQLSLCASNAVEFCFPVTVSWRVILHGNARLNIPWLSEPVGVWRRTKLSRRFTVERIDADSELASR